MINIPNAIPSTLMVESYNNKIRKLLKYGNLSTLTWVVLGDSTPGETNVVVTLPTGNTKTVSVNRIDIALTLGADENNIVELNNSDYVNIEDIAEIQRAVAIASNLSLKNNSVLYSDSFTMSVLLWVVKSIYVPPQDITLTDIVTSDNSESPQRKLLTISNNSLAYVGDVILEVQGNSGAGAPLPGGEYDLSLMTNVGVPGTWEWKSYSPDGWNKDYIISYTVGKIKNTLVTLQKMAYGDAKVIYTEDTSHNVAGEIAITLTPGSTARFDKFIGELKVIIKDLGEGSAYSVSEIQNYSNEWFTSTGVGRYTVNVHESTTNDEIIEMYEMLAARPVYNKIYTRDGAYSEYADTRGRFAFEFNENEMTVKPTTEAEYKQVVGIAFITINRTTNAILPVQVTTVLGNISPTGTYNVSQALTTGDINYNILVHMLQPIAFNPVYKLSSTDLVFTNDESIVTIVPTTEAESRVDIDVMLTIRRVIPKDPVLDLYTLKNITIPEPDYSAPDYDFKNVILDIINTKLVELGKGDVVIDLDAIDMYYQLDWDRWYISVNSTLLDSQLINSFSIKLTDISPGVVRTDLSSISNINKPGQMRLSKEIAPEYSLSPEQLAGIFESATSGTYVDESIYGYRSVSSIFNSGLAVLTPGGSVKPGVVVGELNVLYVEYNEAGVWIPKLNLSEITNVDENGIWAIELPGNISEDNYISVANTIKQQISKIYKTNTDGLNPSFEGNTLTINVDPDALVDANGTLTVRANVTQNTAVSETAMSMTLTTPEDADVDNLSLKLIIYNLVPNNKQWKLWKDGALIASSDGLVFDNNIEIGEPEYEHVRITFKPEFFLGKTVTVSIDGNGKLLELNNNYLTPDLSRTIVVNQFHGNMSEQRFNVTELVEVPDTLPTHITKCSSMFTNASSFNQDIGGWITSHVTEMDYMFSGATSFDQDLSGWCVTNIATAPFVFGPMAFEKQPRWGLCPSGPLTELNAFDLSAVQQGDGEVGYLSIDTSLYSEIIGNETALAEQVIAELNALYTLELTIEDIKYVKRFNYLNIKPSQIGVDKLIGELQVWVNHIDGEA